SFGAYSGSYSRFFLQVPSFSFGTFTLLIVLTAMRKRPFHS
ncbi:integral membrane TerC family protein, partial [Vibrio parahaemolyticus V-223/04]